MTLGVSTWKEFVFGDLISEIYKGKPHTKDELDPAPPTAEVPHSLRYITRTAEDNGCEMLVVRKRSLEEAIEAGNAISIGDTTATCFYQSEDFITGDHMVVLRSEWLNPHTGVFITTLLNAEAYRYSYGRAFIMSSIRNTRFPLPIKRDANGDPIIDDTHQFHPEGYIPDWQFIEEFVRSLNHKPLTTENSTDSVPPLGVSTWEEFLVSSIFEIRNGRGITAEEVAENPGDLKAVQSGEENNGVIGSISVEYCGKMNYVYSQNSVLTVARTGTAGFVSFQPDGCVVGDSAKLLLLKHKKPTVGVLLFLQVVLQQLRFKYNYGRKVTESKYLSEAMDLPIQRDANGDPIIDDTHQFHPEGYIPDWQFMEAYMRSLPFGDRIPEVSEC